MCASERDTALPLADNELSSQNNAGFISKEYVPFQTIDQQEDANLLSLWQL